MSKVKKKRKQYLTLNLKEEILGELVIKGTLYSNKNSQNWGKIRGRMINFGNPKYKNSIQGVLDQLEAQYVGDPLQGPINVHARMWVRNEKWYWKWVEHVQKGLEPFLVRVREGQIRYTGTDTDNKLSSVFEYLKESHVIHDDCQFVDCYVGKRFGKGIQGDYGAKIYLTRHVHEPDERF